MYKNRMLCLRTNEGIQLQVTHTDPLPQQTITENKKIIKLNSCKQSWITL